MLAKNNIDMKVRGERGRSALFVACVYMPTDNSIVYLLWIVVMIGSVDVDM